MMTANKPRETLTVSENLCVTSPEAKSQQKSQMCLQSSPRTSDKKEIQKIQNTTFLSKPLKPLPHRDTQATLETFCRTHLYYWQ